MYLEAAITVDPSQMTEVVRATPTKVFARLASALTRGLTSPQEERETFTAVAILQQLNMVLCSLGIDDIVRITKDDVVFYEDAEGKKGDFKEAVNHFIKFAGQQELQLFNKLDLVLQHSQAGVDYLLDVRISRTHPVDEHPIRIVVNAFPSAMNAQGDDSRVRGFLKRTMASQEKYDRFTSKYVALVESFVKDLETGFHRHMNVDAVHNAVRTKIIRPDRRVHDRNDIPRHESAWHSDPAFGDYYGSNDAFLYAWMWADSCHEHSIHCHDCVLVDESGNDLMEIGSEGLDANQGESMNVETPFDSVRAVAEPTNAEIVDDSGSSMLAETQESTRVSGGEGWLSSFMSSIGEVGGGDGGGDGGGSCGGGCGGGGCGGGG